MSYNYSLSVMYNQFNPPPPYSVLHIDFKETTEAKEWINMRKSSGTHRQEIYESITERYVIRLMNFSKMHTTLYKKKEKKKVFTGQTSR